jgi:D-alanyl-lipoteichoic acid acyltransferase DltB (MBOAT superfamily)
MPFNSGQFALFFSFFFIFYWGIFNFELRAQNLFLLLGSYIFYAWWDWRFLFLLVALSILNYFLGIFIYSSASEKEEKVLFITGLIASLLGLFFFKYFNFFIASFSRLMSAFRIQLNFNVLKITLPLGISFYTFRLISYLIDIKNRKTEPVTDFVTFLSYVAFFPSLISGPIDRVNTLVPQLRKPRVFDYRLANDGVSQIIWGVFKKMAVADSCAGLTSRIFDHYSALPASTLLLGAFYFTIQVYADFSGYSDMAIGFAKLLGFNITRNFDFPFFSQNLAEYWRKWHISLTSWVTDYVFTPLNIALRGYGKAGVVVSILISFTIIGIWHGASWTFVLFGFINGLCFIPLIISGTLLKKKKVESGEFLPSLRRSKNIILTFILVMLTNVLFRADNIGMAFRYWGRLFSFSVFSNPIISSEVENFATLFVICIMLSVEWFNRNKSHGLQLDGVKGSFLRLSIYYFLIFAVLLRHTSGTNPFIYFKF